MARHDADDLHFRGCSSGGRGNVADPPAKGVSIREKQLCHSFIDDRHGRGLAVFSFDGCELPTLQQVDANDIEEVRSGGAEDAIETGLLGIFQWSRGCFS
jgi:hypothetical protein